MMAGEVGAVAPSHLNLPGTALKLVVVSMTFNKIFIGQLICLVSSTSANFKDQVARLRAKPPV